MTNILDADPGFLKIVNDNMHICTSIGTMSSSINFSCLVNRYKNAQWDIMNQHYYYFFRNSTSLLFIDNRIKRNYIKIFLGKGEPNNTFNGWSPEIPITISVEKIEKLFKLKCFL